MSAFAPEPRHVDVPTPVLLWRRSGAGDDAWAQSFDLTECPHNVTLEVKAATLYPGEYSDWYSVGNIILASTPPLGPVEPTRRWRRLLTRH